jgi:hypothetical protein
MVMDLLPELVEHWIAPPVALLRAAALDLVEPLVKAHLKFSSRCCIPPTGASSSGLS